MDALGKMIGNLVETLRQESLDAPDTEIEMAMKATANALVKINTRTGDWRRHEGFSNEQIQGYRNRLFQKLVEAVEESSRDFV